MWLEASGIWLVNDRIDLFLCVPYIAVFSLEYEEVGRHHGLVGTRESKIWMRTS